MSSCNCPCPSQTNYRTALQQTTLHKIFNPSSAMRLLNLRCMTLDGDTRTDVQRISEIVTMATLPRVPFRRLEECPSLCNYTCGIDQTKLLDRRVVEEAG